MILEIYEMLKFYLNYTLKDTVNLIIYLQNCNKMFDDLNNVYTLLRDSSDAAIKEMFENANKYL